MLPAVARWPDGIALWPASHAGVMPAARLKINKEGEVSKKFFDRHFKIDETREINIYGLGDNDHFVVEGQEKSGAVDSAFG